MHSRGAENSYHSQSSGPQTGADNVNSDSSAAGSDIEQPSSGDNHVLNGIYKPDSANDTLAEAKSGFDIPNLIRPLERLAAKSADVFAMGEFGNLELVYPSDESATRGKDAADRSDAGSTGSDIAARLKPAADFADSDDHLESHEDEETLAAVASLAAKLPPNSEVPEKIRQSFDRLMRQDSSREIA
jgi:hypothetical protein